MTDIILLHKPGKSSGSSASQKGWTIYYLGSDDESPVDFPTNFPIIETFARIPGAGLERIRVLQRFPHGCYIEIPGETSDEFLAQYLDEMKKLIKIRQEP